MLAMHLCIPMKTSHAQMEPKTQLPCSTSKNQQPHSYKRDSTPRSCKCKRASKVSGTSDDKPSPQPPCKKTKLEKPPCRLASLPPYPGVRQLQRATATALGQTPHSLLCDLSLIPITRITEVVSQHASTLDTVIHIINSMPTQFAELHPHLSQGNIASQQCHPLLLETLKPVVTRADSNCPYNALSLVLSSSQELHALIRLLCVYAQLKNKSVITEALNDSYRQEHSRPNILRMYAQGLREEVANRWCMGK